MPRKPSKGATAPTLTPGEQIREARTAKGWSQADLAKRIGCSKAFVSALERGEKHPALRWILKHGEVWVDLGLPLEFAARSFAGECPCCGRPY